MSSAKCPPPTTWSYLIFLVIPYKLPPINIGNTRTDCNSPTWRTMNVDNYTWMATQSPYHVFFVAFSHTVHLPFLCSPIAPPVAVYLSPSIQIPGEGIRVLSSIALSTCLNPVDRVHRRRDSWREGAARNWSVFITRFHIELVCTTLKDS